MLARRSMQKRRHRFRPHCTGVFLLFVKLLMEDTLEIHFHLRPVDQNSEAQPKKRWFDPGDRVSITSWWFQIFFMFIPIWGRWTHFDEHIFQMGWWKTTKYRYISSKKKESDRFFLFKPMDYSANGKNIPWKKPSESRQPLRISNWTTTWYPKANHFLMVVSIGWWTKSLHGKWLEITKHPL